MYGWELWCQRYVGGVILGTHSGFKERCEGLERKKEQQLKDAELYRDLRIKEIRELYEFEVKSARDCYNVSDFNLLVWVCSSLLGRRLEVIVSVCV